MSSRGTKEELPVSPRESRESCARSCTRDCAGGRANGILIEIANDIVGKRATLIRARKRIVPPWKRIILRGPWGNDDTFDAAEKYHSPSS